MTTLKFKPVYGFGWSGKGSSIPVPGPFEVHVHNSELTSDQKGYSKVLGVILDPKGQFDGKWIYLSLRMASGGFIVFNVLIYDARPFPFEDISGSSGMTAIATGFAELQN